MYSVDLGRGGDSRTTSATHASTHTAPASTWSCQGVLGKCPRKSLLAGDLLGPDEAIDRHGNRTVDVLSRAILRKTHLGEGFCESHDGFQMTHLRQN